MKVQSERDINIPKLLDEINFRIDKYNQRDDSKGYTAGINIQTLIDCRDVIKALTEGDDCK